LRSQPPCTKRFTWLRTSKIRESQRPAKNPTDGFRKDHRETNPAPSVDKSDRIPKNRNAFKEGNVL